VEGRALESALDVQVLVDARDARVGSVMCQRYQVRRVVANGGMGRVYEGLDLALQRHVALKVLHSEVAQDEVSVERFKREFAVSRQLSHQHIVEVLDFQPTPDGSYLLVLEFLQGEELRATLKRETVLSPARVVRMLSQAALALDQAHAQKLVHRDLKPDNIFLCQTRSGDIVKILDFGSVKDIKQGSAKLTVLGHTIGSPFYMSPEQVQGLDSLDQRTDVWALGAVVYECITGRVPFSGNTPSAILLEILSHEPPPPSIAAAGRKHPVPASVDPVMRRAFMKTASERILSAGGLADQVGAGYGLSGNHLEWAVAPEQELEQRIEGELPRLSRLEPRPSDAVCDHSLPGAALNSENPMALSQPAPSTGSDTTEGLPTTGSAWLPALVVGGMALLIGVLIVIAVMAP
jgi:serine/threonine-protein kinase